MLLFILTATATWASSTASVGLSPMGGGLSGITEPGVLGLAATPTAAYSAQPELAMDAGASLYSLDATLDGEAQQTTDGMVPMPYAGAAMPLGDFGIGVYTMVPYGGGASFPATGPQRFHVIEAEAFLWETGLSAAWQATDWLRVGAAFRAGKGTLVRTQALDTAALINSKTDAGLETGNELFEGSQSLDLSGWAYGYAVGVSTVLPADIGIHVAYRSPMAVQLSGPAEIIPSGDFDIRLTGTADATMTYAREIELGVDIPTGRVRTSINAGWAGWSTMATIDATLTDLAIESDDATMSSLIAATGINESDLLAAGTEVTNDLGHRDVFHGGVAVAVKLHERWTVRPGVFYAPTSLPDETFHLGIVDFPSWDLRAAVAWTPMDWLTTGISVDTYLIESRTITGSGLSLDNAAASGRVLPSANGEYAMSATRLGLTLIARK